MSVVESHSFGLARHDAGAAGRKDAAASAPPTAGSCFVIVGRWVQQYSLVHSARILASISRQSAPPDRREWVAMGAWSAWPLFHAVAMRRSSAGVKQVPLCPPRPGAQWWPLRVRDGIGKGGVENRV